MSGAVNRMSLGKSTEWCVSVLWYRNLSPEAVQVRLGLLGRKENCSNYGRTFTLKGLIWHIVVDVSEQPGHADVTVSHVPSYVLVTAPPPTCTAHHLLSRRGIAVTGVLTPLRRRQRGLNSKAQEIRVCIAALHTSGAAVLTGNI